MAQEMEKLGGTSEEDEDEEELEMEVKEEEDDDVPSGPEMVIGAMGDAMNAGFFDDDQQRRAMAATAMHQQQGGTGSRRCRPKEEKERTKLRERHRRAITARILAGLRRHGNYNLRVRADINEVIAALAREAGWVVLPDGTTFPSRPGPGATAPSPQAGKLAGVTTAAVAPAPAVMATSQAMPLRGVSPTGPFRSLECRPCRLKGVYTPASTPYESRGRMVVMVDRDRTAENSPLVGSSMDTVDDKQVVDITGRLPERDFAGTPYVPVYVMLPLGVVNMKCELVDPDGLLKQLRLLKSINVDGVMVDCWWGIVEAHAPQEYNWSGYKRLFQIVRELKLKLQVVMSFHECGGNVGDDVCIPLPHWVAEIGRTNPDMFFTDKEGRRNPECLTWGIDKERILRGRTAVEVYFDYMRSFRVEFDEFFEDGVISEIEIGLGPCGELRYPSYPVKHGWRYPGIGEFQCYDQYLMKSLRRAAEARGHSFWARGPDNVGNYNSQPHETGFFCDGGDYDGYYGRFFLGWYSQVLVDHADRVLSLSKLAFEGTRIAAKVSGIHWWYKTASHAAELTAGFYNPCNRDGYASIAAMLKKHDAALNFTCVELRTLDQHEDFPEALADPEGLVWQVLNAAWDVSIPVASENALPCHDRDGYNKILENAKPFNDPDGRHLSAFTFLRLSPVLIERRNFLEFERFVKRMHGEAVLDLQT
ncbi:LOW QUALITY PROTEIN: beta-amylase 2, chloroplastic-like [Dioscorea cayenensis subsp. rotundata]|uniref:Beta-amylase n=1 Tax=Dioscorea cayennensis subsp. rotundata TaxID=55577 RepID=A0AB40B7G8_DIOCR|nr:LOW QUALITY PROTEIN: beta-amylase 2, chloroplastic-like [Dioscorea cayenensis subsp. rotundata]